MHFNPTIIPSSAWHRPCDLMPEPMMPVLATDGHGVTIAVWHKSMGQGGDFAMVNKKGKKITLTHLPTVEYWTPIPAIPSHDAKESNAKDDRAAASAAPSPSPC